MTWHVKAHRLKARFPWKDWSAICAEIGSHGKRRVRKPAQEQVVKRYEQMKLF